MRISDWSSDVCSSDLSLSEHTTNVWRPVVSLLAEAAGELDSLDDMRDEVDCAELGRLVLDVIFPHMDRIAHSLAEKETDGDDSDHADYERDARRDEDVERAA